MAGTPDIIAALPSLAQGGAWLLLAGILLYLILQSAKEKQVQDEAHRKERNDQDERHQKAIEKLMDTHSKERTEWVGKIEAAGEKYSKATNEQGEKIARAIADALRSPRP